MFHPIKEVKHHPGCNYEYPEYKQVYTAVYSPYIIRDYSSYHGTYSSKL